MKLSLNISLSISSSSYHPKVCIKSLNALKRVNVSWRKGRHVLDCKSFGKNSCALPLTQIQINYYRSSYLVSLIRFSNKSCLKLLKMTNFYWHFFINKSLINLYLSSPAIKIENYWFNVWSTLRTGSWTVVKNETTNTFYKRKSLYSTIVKTSKYL